MADVTDATFQNDVVERSRTVPVVVDLWAPWCGPCRVLGPILDKVVGATGGQVELAKVNVDENPAVAQAFGVQTIPAVFALREGAVVDQFVGAQPESAVSRFVAQLLPGEEETEVGRLVAKGDETSLRSALELDPAHAGAVVALADLYAGEGRTEEALALLERIPPSADTRRVAARARLGSDVATDDSLTARLDALLERIPGDDGARQEYLDLLELLGPSDPRTLDYRRALTARLF
ncbi:MAG TPA: thioredoxin [Acidimicrobiales bacterium]|jgi:putative thioredoxin|nr:thioredoxin [Acidimicrobiales bacterium]